MRKPSFSGYSSEVDKATLLNKLSRIMNPSLLPGQLLATELGFYLSDKESFEKAVGIPAIRDEYSRLLFGQYTAFHNILMRKKLISLDLKSIERSFAISFHDQIFKKIYESVICPDYNFSEFSRILINEYKAIYQKLEDSYPLSSGFSNIHNSRLNVYFKAHIAYFNELDILRLLHQPIGYGLGNVLDSNEKQKV